MKDLNKKFFSKLGFILLVYSLLHQIVGPLGFYIVSRLNLDIAEDSVIYYLAQLLPTYLIAFPIVCLLFCKLIPADKPEQHKMKFWQWLLAFMMLYGIGISINVIVQFIYFILQLFNKGLVVENPIMNLMSEINPVAMILIVGIIAPIVEETVFRKLLIDRLLPYGERIAIFLPGIIFGIFHGNLFQCFFAAAIGIFFSFIYTKTGKIKYTVFMHMTINLYSCILMIFVNRLVSSGIYDDPEKLLNGQFMNGLSGADLMNIMIPAMALSVMVCISFCIVIAGIVLFIIFHKRFKLSQNTEPLIARGNVFKTVVLNPGMICLGIFWIAIFVINTLGIQLF